MEIIYNAKGDPLMFLGSKSLGISKTKIKNEEVLTSFTYGNVEYASWGDNNKYPNDALEVIGKTGVLSTALNYKCRCCYGQGVLPVTMQSLDENNKELFKPLNEREILDYLRGYSFRNYHTTAFRDVIKLGNCFPVYTFNADGNKIINTQIINARHCRLSIDKSKLLIFPNFETTFPCEEDAIVIDVLHEDYPELHLSLLKEKGLTKGKSVAFPRLKNYFSNNDYYALPDWDTAWKSGWLDVASKIPTLLKKAYQNAMSLMWHIQVPDTFWEKKFPKEEYESVKARQDAINKYLSDFETELCSEENPAKTLLTDYTINESGKAEEKWEIDRLKNEINVEERLSTSAAANSEILFSLMVNPSVLGAGMPGGPYAGNVGSGSDIREGLLVSLILNYIEKQQVLDPIELMLKFNGFDAELMYRNIILTTLDKGKSTEEKLS